RSTHQLLDLIRITDHFDRKRSIECERLCRGAEILVLTGKENCLNIQFATHQFLKDLRNVPAADPSGVYKHRELLGIESKRLARSLSRLFAGIRKLRMHRQT